MINKVTRRSTTLDQTHFTVDTLGLGRLLPARAILSAGTSRRIWALVYVWGTLVYVCFVSSMGTTGSREHNATIEGRKFAISTRARHVSSQPPPRLTNLLSCIQRFSFPFIAFPNWKFAPAVSERSLENRVPGLDHREFYVSNVFDSGLIWYSSYDLIITLNIRDIYILDRVWNLIKDHREFYSFQMFSILGFCYSSYDLNFW